MLEKVRDRLARPHYLSVRERELARIAAWKLTVGSDLSAVVDSLDLLELQMEMEDVGMEPTVAIKTVGDLLWLLRAIELRFKKEQRFSA